MSSAFGSFPQPDFHRALLALPILSESQLHVLLLQLYLLYTCARVFGEVFRRWHQPPIVGELLAGVVLGPTLFGRFWPSGYAAVFPNDPIQSYLLEAIAWFGMLLLLLAAGLEVDLNVVKRRGRAAILTGLAGMVFPLLGGLALGLLLPDHLLTNPDQRLLFAAFLGTAIAISALPVVAKILVDLDLLKTDVGLITIAAATLNDLVGWIVFSAVMSLVDVGTFYAGNIVQMVLVLAAITAIFFVILPPILERVLYWLRHSNISAVGAVLTVTLSFVFLGGVAMQWAGIHALFGAFLVGLVVGKSPQVTKSVRMVINEFAFVVLGPIFFATVGLRVDMLQAFVPGLVLSVFVVACVSKIGGCYLGARCGRLQADEALAVGVGMNTRGALGIVMALIALEHGLIGQEVFVALVVMAIGTSLLSGPLLQRLIRSAPPQHWLERLTSELVMTELPSQSVKGVVEALVERLVQVHPELPSAEEIVEHVLNRERVQGTGVGHSIAVPHARLEQLEHAYVAVGRSLQGVPFDSPDDQPAHLIFLTLTPSTQSGLQLRILATIAHAFGHGEGAEEVVTAPTEEHFQQRLLQFLQTADKEIEHGEAARIKLSD